MGTKTFGYDPWYRGLVEVDTTAVRQASSSPRGRRRPWPGPVPYSFPGLLLLILALLPRWTLGAWINFDNCLDSDIVHSNPLQLQFIPLHLWAYFNTTAASHNLNITVYGNVSGQATVGDYPSANDSSWSNPNDTFGKIVNVDEENNKYTTLYELYKVLTFTPYNDPGRSFCNTTLNTECPIAPSFYGNYSDPSTLSAFTVAHDFYSSYSFSTVSATIRVNSGDKSASHLACVSANITPDLGSTLADTIAYVPAAILALVAIATISAAVWSPWGSTDPFRWTSNYGRDEDLLRLVTPGFGDCLQYIQFIVLAGSLNLKYPGFYQPVVSQASWSVLLFNASLVSHENGTQSVIDGMYFANGTYGLSRLAEYVGMSEDYDMWAGMTVWLVGVTASVVIAAELCFFVRFLYRTLANKQEEDHRSKNWPFTVGLVVRMVFNYFLLPVVSLSMFQLVIAGHSPAVVVAMAVVLLLAVIGWASWIFWLIFTTRPRASLFDDLQTVLMYGPLYNTYSDEAAPFAFIPVLLSCMRGVAIGAIQPSGIAQIVLLAICEVILILTLHAFRPFQAPTSMNAYHTFFSAIRLATILLMVAFVPSLGVSEASKGWIGYVVLLLHAIVLIFGFFMNSIQTLIEVAARASGAGADTRGGLTKVFGMRQLSKRTVRSHRRNQRSSLTSTQAMLAPDSDAKSLQLMGATRARSYSNSSAILLAQQRSSGVFDRLSQGGEYSQLGTVSPTPTTPAGTPTALTYLPAGSVHGSVGAAPRALGEPIDPYYRPPRPRGRTMDAATAMSGARGTDANAGDGRPNEDYPDTAVDADAGEGPSSFTPRRGSLTPAYIRAQKDELDFEMGDKGKPTDYTVRESDFYYGIRGPALSNQPTRKLKTGPADPMGPVSSATGWLKGLFNGKRKEKGKGFEVVRSTRMPPNMMSLEEEEELSPPGRRDSYHDDPEAGLNAGATDGAAAGKGRSLARDSETESSDVSSLSTEGVDSEGDDPFDHHINRISEAPPMLGPIEAGGGIELPSRVGSRATSKTTRSLSQRAPTIPRKSSKRTQSADKAFLEAMANMPNLTASSSEPKPIPPPGSQLEGHLHPSTAFPARLPFASAEPSPSPEHSAPSSLFHSTEAPTESSQTQGPLAPSPVIGADGGSNRPMNTGYVHHHKASDSIQRGRYESSENLGTSAELVDVQQRGSVSTRGSVGQ